VFSQNYINYEVIIVDNNSTDKTIDIIKTYPVKHILNVDKYIPGDSINKGIMHASGDIVIMLSSHCIPKNKDWILRLVSNFENSNIAGVYGRQIPMSYSSPYDVRDLLITFGMDKRTQVKDYFFHNANSAILKSVWEEIPFDSVATNVEDRIWAKKVVESGYNLVYDPDACVYHHHGIHHNQDLKRASDTVKVLREIEEFNHKDWLPISAYPENRYIVAIITIEKDIDAIGAINPIQDTIDEIVSTQNINKLYLISREKIISKYVLYDKCELLERPNFIDTDDVSLAQVLKWGLEEINKQGLYPEYVVYANPIYVFKPENLLNRLIDDVCYKGLDSVFVGYKEFADHWAYDDDIDDYVCFGDALKARSEKRELFKSLIGSGCITRSRIIRDARIIGDKKIGIITTSDVMHTLKISDPVIFSIIDKI